MTSAGRSLRSAYCRETQGDMAEVGLETAQEYEKRSGTDNKRSERCQLPQTVGRSGLVGAGHASMRPRVAGRRRDGQGTAWILELQSRSNRPSSHEPSMLPQIPRSVPVVSHNCKDTRR